MRVFYDGAIYGIQQSGGINRYFASLVEGLPHDVTPILHSTCVRAVNFPKSDKLELQVQTGRQPKLRHIHRIWARHQKSSKSNSPIQADLVHPTYYKLLNGRDIQTVDRPLVVTVHDMIHERFAKQIDPTGLHAEMKRRAVFAADKIICVSHCTKFDLLDRYPFLQHKVSVVYHGSQLLGILPATNHSVCDGPYFMFVGNRAPYKNFDRVLQALQKVCAQRGDVKLCIVGTPIRRREWRKIHGLNLERFIFHAGIVDDQQLANLYASSIALVYPSLYEGFGIPPLEAMSCGTAVIASNNSSIPEVVGDAGLLIDPYSSKELADSMLELAEDDGVREALVRRGRRRAKMFTWKRTVAETLDVYRAVAVCEQSSSASVPTTLSSMHPPAKKSA